MAQPLWGHSVPITTVEATGLDVLDLGGTPGWLALSSPQAAVRWVVDGAEGGRQFRRFFETGPASGQAVEIGREGTTVRVLDVQLALVASTVSFVDGSVVIAAPAATNQPRARARFWPSNVWQLEQCDGEKVWRYYPQIGPVLQPSPMTRVVTAVEAAPDPVIIGFPPGNRDQLQVRATGPVILEIRQGPPSAGSAPLYRSAAIDSHSLDVSPQHWVTVETPTPTIRPLQALWRNVGGIRQV